MPALLSLGRIQLADAQLQEGVDRLDAYDFFSQVSWYGARAGTRLRQGRLEEATADAARALSLFAEKPLVMFTHCGSFALVAEVMLAAAATGERCGALSAAEVRALTAQALKSLKTGATLFPYFRPRALLYRGTAAWQSGRRPAARRHWRGALAAAERYGMPWDRGRIHLELARHAAPEAPERAIHERAARAVLEPMGAAGDLALLAPPGG